MRPRLRLYTGENVSDRFGSPKVSVPLGELAQVLNEAARWNRAWIHDFSEDNVEVSADLYEILSTYWHLRPSA